MTMTVRYNIAANDALSYVNENSKATVKSLFKVASGMKITSAGDDPANFSISERMRVKLRALDQNTRNVLSGRGILDAAADGIASQIDMMRTIRSKVVESANDSTTDEDRQTIQKELNQLYEQMEITAYDTKYNSMRILLANSKILSDAAQEIERTTLNLIPDEYSMLDGVIGPFDIFSEYSSTTKTLGTTSGYVAGTPGTSSTVATMDFSSFSDVSQLNNVGFTVNGSRYVLTDDMSKTYRYAYSKIALGATVDETIDNIVSRFSSYGATRVGNTIQMNTSLGKTSDAGGDITTYAQISHTGTGAGVSGTTNGGVTNATGDSDLPAAAKASLTVDLSGVTSNTGFRFNGVNFRVLDPGATGEGTVNRTLTKGSSSSGTAGSFSYTFDGNNLTFTANSVGANYNGYSITNSYTYYTNGEPTTTSYTAYTAFNGAIGNDTTTTPGTSATPGSWSLDLSGKTVDDFSAEYAGKTLYFNGTYRKFYDSGIEPKLESFREDSGSRTVARTQIDINSIRQAVNNGTSLAQAVKNNLGMSNTSVDGDSVKFTANSNSAQINLITENLRHYDVDFSGLDVNFPRDLYGKGFRAYCATDNREWFNFVFTDGTNNYTSDADNVKPVNINVSRVTNTQQLVQAIYDQANEILTGDDPKYNHHLRVAADLDNLKITLYDHRRFDVSQAPYVYQELGAKIADGLLLADDTDDRDYWIKDLVIQDTDSADMNIRIKIPQMTLDQIFNPLPEGKTIYDYTVTEKEIRDALLGDGKKAGILDKGLKYLIDAVTSVGAQSKRLESTLETIWTESSNLNASESVIRDADMAKEMTAFVKNNILTQSSQLMLAHANQVQALILPLLTGKEEETA